MIYLLLVVPFVLLAVWAGSHVKGSFHRWNQVPMRSGYSGAEAAQAILHGAGIYDVGIEAVPGMLSDHYDPRSRTVRLSEEVLHGRSVAAVAVATKNARAMATMPQMAKTSQKRTHPMMTAMRSPKNAAVVVAEAVAEKASRLTPL